MRLIDGDKLKDEVLKWLPSDPCGVEEKEMPFETDIVVSMMLTLDEAPNIDIVRCKECRHRNERCGMGERRWCERLNMSTTPDDFCSYGERSSE